mgnify:FL=1
MIQLLEKASVDISTDGGTVWTNLWQRIGENDHGPTTQLVDITSEVAGESSLLIRFHYDTKSTIDDLGKIWQVDDVEVITTTGKLPTTDICGNAYNLPQQQWRLISLPCNPGVTNTPTGQFGDDISGTYGTDWLMYEYDGVNNKYNSLSDS